MAAKPKKLKRKKSPDWWIFFAVMLLVGIGIIMVFSASQYSAQLEHGDAFHYLKSQAFNAVLGLVAMFVMYRIDYRLYKAVAWYVYFGALVLLLMVLFSSSADSAGGATRWLDLGFVRFQPSEVAKIAIVMLMAKLLTENQKVIKTFKKGFVPCFVLMAFTAGLVLAQKDLSTSVIIVGVSFLMMFCAGVRIPYLAGTVGLGVLAVIGAIIAEPYRLQRITAYLDPWSDPGDTGYQAVQSLLAIGNGGLTGVGLGQGGSTWLYLPEGHTDFIFSVLTEELGFLGGLLVVCLFVVLIWRGLAVAVKMPDTFGSLLAMGLTTLIGLQAFMNLGVVTGLLPVTGITLPFISYGGTSLLISLASVGLLLNLSRFAEIKR